MTSLDAPLPVPGATSWSDPVRSATSAGPRATRSPTAAALGR
ncbi:MAG: hypothetical protein ACP5VP_08180 [Candidatus Limnocylindrales bacterium]